MADCTEKKKNMQDCNCTYSCSKKGKCCECLAYHRSMGEFPACYFNAEGEKTYDRSFENLKKYRK
ncbi:MAG: hypothetical protein A2583_10730 [Bdellovibrionales bacterium RIFOXYD1_FULL_53_11]|nr:MAG: hypothetical protein A2583_10730 [Bdellovibrionales bacterium RIFOXYD1_FULL_53_11]